MASRKDTFPETICRPISCRNSAPAKRSARKFRVSGWAMVPSKSLNTASGLAAADIDCLEKDMKRLRLLSAAVLNYGEVFHKDRFTNPVIPAKAGIQDTSIPATATLVWMPACAGMTYGTPDCGDKICPVIMNSIA